MPENRPQNTTANHSVPADPSAITWSPTLDYWTDFVADRNHVSGDFTGTTDEILQWVARKWGIDEDIVRADAVVESNWVQSEVGDNCGVTGEASYGILQVKNKDCSGDWSHGGWPYTQNDTALDADYWGANRHTDSRAGPPRPHSCDIREGPNVLLSVPAGTACGRLLNRDDTEEREAAH
jgi:hypothetical protein